jgi:hypothetical protein
MTKEESQQITKSLADISKYLKRLGFNDAAMTEESLGAIEALTLAVREGTKDIFDALNAIKDQMPIL